MPLPYMGLNGPWRSAGIAGVSTAHDLLYRSVLFCKQQSELMRAFARSDARPQPQRLSHLKAAKFPVFRRRKLIFLTVAPLLARKPVKSSRVNLDEEPQRGDGEVIDERPKRVFRTGAVPNPRQRFAHFALRRRLLVGAKHPCNPRREPAVVTDEVPVVVPRA